MFRKLKDVVKSILPKHTYDAMRNGILTLGACGLGAVKLALFPIASVYMWWLNLKQPTRLSAFHAARIGHLALNTDLFLRTSAGGGGIRIIFLVPRLVANDFLLQRWGDIVEIVRYDKNPILAQLLDSLMFFSCNQVFSINSVLHLKLFEILPFKLPSRYAFELPYEGNEYEVYHTTKGQFYFTESEKQEGDRILQEMGIGKEDWFVCVFARDRAYLDNVFHYDEEEKKTKKMLPDDYRDSDIDSLHLAIDEILSRGGFVIRLGKVVAKAMSYQHERVIDYPLSRWRSDFMDIYLQYRAKFVLSSSTSGATDIVSLFDTPYCGVNMPAYSNMPYRNALQIAKNYRQNGKMISFREWIKMVEMQKADRHYGCDYSDPAQLRMWHSDFYLKNNLEIINNTPEEILDLTKEMFERLDGSFIQSQEDKQLQDQYLAINATYLPYKDCKNPYGREFLRKNQWFLA